MRHQADQPDWLAGGSNQGDLHQAANVFAREDSICREPLLGLGINVAKDVFCKALASGTTQWERKSFHELASMRRSNGFNRRAVVVFNLRDVSPGDGTSHGQ